MGKYWKYLKYVVKHRWFVMQEGLKLGVPFWQLLIHDLSKFRPDEFIPYARYFYGEYRPWSDFTPGLKLVWLSAYHYSKEGVEEAFNKAWLKHIHRNPHHHQHWVLREDSGAVMALCMPHHYMLEMVADWRGAGRAINGKDDTRTWYMANRDKMMLNSWTREQVEDILKLGVSISKTSEVAA